MARSDLKRRLERLEDLAPVAEGKHYSTVFGIVSSDQRLVRTVKKVKGEWIEVDEPADKYLAEILERVLYTDKRFVIVYGGRGSGKSVGMHDIALAKVRDYGAKVLGLREYMESIKDSSHSLFKEEIERHGMEGFDVQDQQIKSVNGGLIRYRGIARNPGSVKSAAGFDLFLIEEADNLSSKSITTLTPTARNKARFGTPEQIRHGIMTDTTKDKLANVQMFFMANPKSRADAFYQRFIEPFHETCCRDGYYEDDLHLVIRMNYTDNPWYEFSGLEKERLHDKANCTAAKYSHVWEGEPLDEVSGSIIMQEWFDAAVDAHEKLGIQPTGQVIVGFDPSDQGADPKGIVVTKGILVVDAIKLTEGDAFCAAECACDIARKYQADKFAWDCDGTGALLRNEITRHLGGSRIELIQYRGSNTVDKPDSIYDWENKGVPVKQPSKNKDTFANRRAQRTWSLRDRFYYTWRAVNLGEYIDPAKLIAISSKIKDLNTLRSETCRIPLDDDKTKVQVMSKKDMKRMQISSPNLFDALTCAEDARYVDITKKAAPNWPSKGPNYTGQRRT